MEHAGNHLPVNVFAAACCILEDLLCFIKVDEGLGDFELSLLADFVFGSVVKKGDFVDKSILIEQEGVQMMMGEFD